MRKIIEYKSVAAENLLKLDEKVNPMIADGWQPYGNISVAIIPPSQYVELCMTMTQVMVRYEDA